MSDRDVLSPAEERIEEIRAIRRRLFGGVGTDYRKLRELASAIPEGFRVLSGVRPIETLAVQLDQREHGR